MDQLKGKVVNVVLTVQEGKGMESIKTQMYISANFNGRILESDPVSPEENPSFNTNLIWEIEKRELRKLRSSNQPLRVECLTVDAQNRRERFGHLLLDLRGAQIVSESTQVQFKWQKLIGVRNKKRNCHPELFISLTLRSHFENKVEVEESLDEAFCIEPRVDGGVPLKYLDGGFIVIGSDSEAKENFSLNLLIKSASNLDLLLPEVLVFNQNKNKYSLCLKIFGVPINTKQFNKDLHEKITFEERIVVRLLSNYETLKKFFKEEKIEVGFYCGSDLLGLTTVPFEGLANLNEKTMLGSCFFKFPSANGIVPIRDNRKPSLALELFLMKNSEHEDEMIKSSLEKEEAGRACGDHVERVVAAAVNPPQVIQLITEEQVKEFEEWKEAEKEIFMLELEELKRVQVEKNEEIFRAQAEDLAKRKQELDEGFKQCRSLQEELTAKLEEINLVKALRNKRKSSNSLHDAIVENQKRFQDCDKELLIDYISKLQEDGENLKEIIAQQKQELSNIEKTALTKEQTANLLQELKGLEEKFQIAQQTKTYFKEQWKKACEEIHDLKAEDYRQLQDQLKERREELSQLSLDNFSSETKLITF